MLQPLLLFLTQIQISRAVVSKRTLFVCYNIPVTTEVSNCFVNTDVPVPFLCLRHIQKRTPTMSKAVDLSNNL